MYGEKKKKSIIFIVLPYASSPFWFAWASVMWTFSRRVSQPAREEMNFFGDE